MMNMYTVDYIVSLQVFSQGYHSFQEGAGSQHHTQPCAGGAAGSGNASTEDDLFVGHGIFGPLDPFQEVQELSDAWRSGDFSDGGRLNVE